jgi:hypothetical protein
MCRKAMRNNFLHRGTRKKRLLRGRLRDALSWRMDLRNHNLNALKNNFGQFNEALIQDVKEPCEHISASRAFKKATWTKSLK